MISKLRTEKLLKLNNNWKFENLIALLFMIFGILGWQFNYALGAIPTILLSVLLMIIYDDFKYAIPAILVLLFSYGTGFEISVFPFEIVIPVAIFVIFVIVFTVIHFKKENLKHIRFCIGMAILSIAFIIPIFWCKLIDETNMVFYVMYFSWLMYTLLYLLLCFNLNKKSFKMLVFSLSHLSLLITIELVISVVKLKIQNPDQNILSFWYYIGWGLCNEAGIMLCFIMPFIFYELIKSDTLCLSLISIFKIGISLIGIVLTGSRGTLLFGGLEIVALVILLFVFKFPLKKEKLSFLSFIFFIGLTGIITLTKGELFTDIFNNIFEMDLDSNGRDLLWKLGFEAYRDSGHYFFGSGIVSEIREKEVFNGVQNTFIVYHNTFIEVLISAGVSGLVGISYHLFEKYKMLFKKDNIFKFTFLIGYIFVDLYGLIDNTYGMYYYMVPLVMVLAIFRLSDNYELYDKINNDLF